MSQQSFYDALSHDYDRFVNWESRLGFEMPFFERWFARHDVKRVLDVACGTGHHAIALAKRGYDVTGVDANRTMIEHARANAADAGVQVDFHVLGFGDLSETLGEGLGQNSGGYDALTCLGNSLPHLTDEASLRAALRDFAAVLRPEGIVIVQNRNFDRVLEARDRFMPPEVHSLEGEEWIFYRFYDFLPNDLLRFNMVRLYREKEGGWSAAVEETRLRAWRFEELSEQLEGAGLEVLGAYGSYGEEPFQPSESGDLVLVGRRR
jgi:SAM-dependent methyltransferase